MAFVVFWDDSDAGTVEDALRSSEGGRPFLDAGFSDWRSAPAGLSPCSDPEVAVEGSRRIMIDGDLYEFAQVLTSLGLSSYAADAIECGEVL